MDPECYYQVSDAGVVRYRLDGDDPLEPDLEWAAPGLLLRLVLAGCPLADVGTADLGATIELHPGPDGGIVAITAGAAPVAVALDGDARAVALNGLL